MRPFLALCLAASAAFAQVSAQPTLSDWANLREDVRLLSQKVGELTLRLEQLERENSTLQRKADSGSQAVATVSQLNDAIAEINRSTKSAVAASKADTLQHVATMMEKLATQTNAALDALQKGGPAQVSFSDHFPKEGAQYIVQSGDTIGKIVQKTGAKKEDIINANKISNPSKLQAGQILFIPGAK
jgi:LysM repeat protein